MNTQKKLTKKEKEQVIRWLSEFYTYIQVVDLVREHFAKAVTRQTIEYYAKKYAEIIEAKRLEFLTNLERIPEANKAVRIDRLAKLCRKLEKYLYPGKGWIQISKEYRDTLRQIAEEMGQIEEKMKITGEITFFNLVKRLRDATENNA